MAASVTDLEARWSERARTLEPYAPAAAVAFASCIADLREALATGGEELLTLREAARLSGYSADHLGRLVRRGRLANRGTPRRPLVAAVDLPRKPAQTGSARRAAEDVVALHLERTP